MARDACVRSKPRGWIAHGRRPHGDAGGNLIADRRFRSTYILTMACLSLAAIPASAGERDVAPGVTLSTAPAWAGRSVVRAADGTWERFSLLRDAKLGDQLAYATSADDGVTWSAPHPLTRFPADFRPGGGSATVVTRDGEVHFFMTVGRREGEGTRPAIDRFIDIWHVRSTDGRTKWTAPKRMFAGYVGSICKPIELASGRILMPIGSMIGGRAAAPPFGRNEVVVYYSDDKGETFKEAPARLVAAADPDFNGSNEGACEPCAVQLKDGRVVMLMRTSSHVLYESISPDGADWPQAWPSRFFASTGPPDLLRLPDDRIVLLWNNSQLQPKVDGVGVYGGRDALHAAIADSTWTHFSGFREVYRDPTRNDTPPEKGDRGTAYPAAVLSRDGQRVVFASGQGGRRAVLSLRPSWLMEKEHASDFSNGVDDWLVYKSFGPAKRWWRDRTIGASLVPHPDRPADRVLHLRRPDEKEADGASWNFPSGRRGTLTIRLRPNLGGAGGTIALGDRQFDPCDDAGERAALFKMSFDERGSGDRWELAADQWHEVTLEWDVDAGTCHVAVNGQDATKLPLRGTTPDGIGYLRLRSVAMRNDISGFFVERVQAKVD